jgi:hypothetical protein
MTDASTYLRDKTSLKYKGLNIRPEELIVTYWHIFG